MSIITKRKELLDTLNRIQSMSSMTESDRTTKHTILRRLCEAEVKIDLDEEPDFDGEGN